MLSLPADQAGVLPSQHLLAAIDAGVIDADPFTVPRQNVQPASLDLRLGEVAYRIRCSFLPDSRPVERKAQGPLIDELDLHGDGAVLETNRPYLIPLKERLALPAGVRGKANPKSSTGRVDVFTRVITDEQLPLRRDRRRLRRAGCTSRSCRSRSRCGCARTSRSTSCGCRSAGPSSTDDDLRARPRASTPLLFRDGAPVPADAARPGQRLFLGLDLRGDADGRVGYRARDHAAAARHRPRSAPSTRAVLGAGARARTATASCSTPQRFYLLHVRRGGLDPARRWRPR